MRKRDEIKKVFGSFIESIDKGQLDRIKKYTTKNIKAYISYAGESEGQEELISALTWHGPKINTTRKWITNFAVRTSGDLACQSAYLITMLGYDDGQFLFPFEYGGSIINKYTCEDGKWKISEIRFEIDWVCGNTYFAKDWQLIDYSIYHGHKPYICSEFDSPWAVIPENDEELSDIELLKETLDAYCFGVDHTDYELIQSVEDGDNFKFISGEAGQEVITADGSREHLLMVKNLSYREPALQHPYRYVDIKVNGDEGEILAYLVRADRLRTKVLNKLTLNNQYYTGCLLTHVKKVDGKWKLTDFHYSEPRVFFETGFADKYFVDEY